MIWLGDTDRSWNLENHDLKWSHKPIRYLGHYIYFNNNEALKMDWEQKLIKLRKKCDSWTKRSLTIFGRVTVLKSLALSQVTHLIMVDSIPPNFLKMIEGIIFKFIWSGKTEKIKRVSLMEDYSKRWYKNTWHTKAIVQLPTEMVVWVDFSMRVMERGKHCFLTGSTYWEASSYCMLNCSYNITTLNDILVQKKIPSFYVEILKAWEMIRYCTTVKDVCISIHEPVKVSDQIFWHNKHVVYDNQSLFYNGWYDSGLVFLGDLFTIDGFRSTEYIKSQVHSKRKCNAMFDYARLKREIPPVWVNSLKEEFMHDYTRQENENKVPYLLVANKVKHVTDISSNRFYKLIPSRTVLTNTCCLYWEKNLMSILIGLRYSSVILHKLEKANYESLTWNYCIIYCQ